MNLLYVTPYYAPAYPFGGVVRAVEELARVMARRGHGVTVLTTDALAPGRRAPGPADSVTDGVRVVRAPNLVPRGTLNLSSPRGLGALADELLRDADLVHAHEFRTVENLLVAPRAARGGVPLVLSPHGTLALETGRGAAKRLWDAVFSPRLARHFVHVVGLTAYEAEEARRFWAAFGATGTRIHVVPNGIDPAPFEAAAGGDAFRARHGLGDGPVCLFLGRLHPRKGPHLLAEAFAGLDVPDARLVLAGPDEGALPLIRPHLGPHAVVTGYLDADERLSALAAADLFALPAVGEGLSVALLEALAAGVPALLTPGCNAPEVAASGAGLEVPRAVPALRDALAALLPDAPRLRAMGAAAQQLVRDRFRWDSVATRMEAVYREAARPSPAP